jgi:hypothetical protein
MAAGGRTCEWRVLRSVHICAGFHQQLHDVQTAVGCSPSEWIDGAFMDVCT